MASALLSGPGGAVEKLKSSFDVFKYTVGDTVANAVTPFVEKITALLDKFNNMDEAQQKQIVKWAAMAAAVGPGLMMFGKVVSTVGKVGVSLNKIVGIASRAAGGFKALRTGAGLVQAGIAALTSPIALVWAAITALIVVIISIKTHFDVFKAALNSTSPTFQRLKTNIQKLMTTIQPLISKVQEVAPVFMNVFGTVIAGACGTALSILGALLAGVTTIVTGIIEVIQGIITFVTGPFTVGWSAGWEGVKQIFSGIWDVIKGIVESAIGVFGGLADSVKGLLGLGGEKSKSSASGKVPGRAVGDRSWRGGLVQVHERGGEILDLPRGTRIYPHDVSMQMAKASAGQSINIPKLADTIVVREDADINRIADTLLKKIKAASGNMGGVNIATNMA